LRPTRARRAGAADPVDVGVLVHGRIEVDHVRDVREIEPAGGDVGGHERRDLSAANWASVRLRAARSHLRRTRVNRIGVSKGTSGRGSLLGLERLDRRAQRGHLPLLFVIVENTACEPSFSGRSSGLGRLGVRCGSVG
jgi:hypothetical protein